jgi:hypothetical protein
MNFLKISLHFSLSYSLVLYSYIRPSYVANDHLFLKV